MSLVKVFRKGRPMRIFTGRSDLGSPCGNCKHKNTCEGYGELIKCYYGYPDAKKEVAE